MEQKRNKPPFCQQKENLGNRRYDKLNVPKELRPAFTELHVNTTSDIKTVRKSTTTVETHDVVTTQKLRSISESGLKKIVKSSTSENFSECVTTKTTETDTDDVFIEERATNFTSVQQQDGVRKSSQEVESTSLKTVSVQNTTSGVTKKVRQKTTLSRKQSNNHAISAPEDPFEDSWYAAEYLTFNYNYMLNREKLFIYEKTALKECLDESCRVITVNWLMCVHRVLRISETTLFAAVRIFDNFLVQSSEKIAPTLYGLIAIASLWIANKITGTRPISVSTLFYVCKEKLPKSAIVSMEKSILKTLDFDVSYADLLIFLYHYLRTEQLVESRKIRLEAMYLLELFTMLVEFSSSPPSILAATAIHIVLVRNNINCQELLKIVDATVVKKSFFVEFSKRMKCSVEELLKSKKLTSEVFAKYSREDNLKVANNFY